MSKSEKFAPETAQIYIFVSERSRRAKTSVKLKIEKKGKIPRNFKKKLTQV